MSYRIIYSTMGQATPATVAADAADAGGRAGGYLYRGDPTRSPDHPDYIPLAIREPEAGSGAAPESHRRARRERVAQYVTLMAELTQAMTKDAALIEAAKQIGVGVDTLREYDRELRRAAGS